MPEYRESPNNIFGDGWWMNDLSDVDYTKNRKPVTYTVDDLIGRKDVNKYTLVTPDQATISGTDSILV